MNLNTFALASARHQTCMTLRSERSTGACSPQLTASPRHSRLMRRTYVSAFTSLATCRLTRLQLFPYNTFKLIGSGHLIFPTSLGTHQSTK